MATRLKSSKWLIVAEYQKVYRRCLRREDFGDRASNLSAKNPNAMIANDEKNALAARKGRFANNAGERSSVLVPVPGTASVRNARDDQNVKIAERRSIAMAALAMQGESAKLARSFPGHVLQKVGFLIYSGFSGLIICDQIVVLEGFSPSRRTSRSRKEKCRKWSKERATW
jgi:hypothetical protein